MPAPLFPGSTAVSNLRVYESETEDGRCGGSPHVHTVSSEAYVVVAGEGEAHTISSAGFAVDSLAAGSLLWFSPGTIHRLVNLGGLEIVTVMQNSGLPEAGDAVLTFPVEILRDAEAYADAVRLPVDEPIEVVDAAAQRRRDLAMRGYLELRAATEAGDTAALDEFYRLAAALVRPRVDGWRELWSQTVEAETERTRSQLDALARGDASHLSRAAVARPTPRPEPRRFGMCGRLQIWELPNLH